MRLLRRCWIVAAMLLPLGAQAQQRQPPIDIIIALPAQTLTFSAPFLAEDAGFYKEEGLNVKHVMLVGVASVNAVINGSADFTIGTGPVFLRAAAKATPLLAIANLMDKPMVELVLRKDVADAVGFSEKMTLAERGRLLKGRTIAIQGVGSIVHAWERLVAARGGLDPENDVRIAPMDPPAMLAALQTKAVEGYTTSLPYTTEAVVTGLAVMLASAPQGAAPDLEPFGYGLVATKPETCAKQPDKCRRVVHALAHANAMIRGKPDEALAILRKRFKDMNQTALDAAWKVVAAGHAKDISVTAAALENSERVNIEAKLLDPKDRVTSFDKLYTNEFIR